MAIARHAQLDTEPVLDQLARQIAGRKQCQLLLLGQPIPKRVGGEPVEVDWRTIEIPQIRGHKGRKRGATRSRNRERSSQASITMLAALSSGPLRFLTTENWSPSHTHARGRFEVSLRRRSTALIGCGALGSAVAELLVRGGVERMLLFDGDTISIGNLCRHTATATDLGGCKASVLADRLRSASPLLEVEAIAGNLPRSHARVLEALERTDLVVDCTASDDVLGCLARARWSKPRVFVSTFFDLGACRSFVFIAHGHQFPMHEFRVSTSPLLERMTARVLIERHDPITTGCWNPSFPARADDVWLVAVAVVKRVAAMVEMGVRVNSWSLRVYEQAVSSSDFEGLQIVYDDGGAL